MTETAEATLARDHRGCKILLAEDVPVNRELVRRFLKSIQPDIDMAEDGKQALGLAGSKDYDLILMDVLMPQMDGLDATRHIRGLPQGKTIPIIAITANADTEIQARCMAAGMNDFIAKPVNPAILFETLLKWLRPGPHDIECAE